VDGRNVVERKEAVMEEVFEQKKFVEY